MSAGFDGAEVFGPIWAIFSAGPAVSVQSLLTEVHR